MKSSWYLCLSGAAIYGQILLKINDFPKTDVTQLTYELSTSRELAYSVHRPLPLCYLWCFLIVVTLHTISASWSALDMYTALTFPGNITMWEVLSSREPAGRSLTQLEALDIRSERIPHFFEVCGFPEWGSLPCSGPFHRSSGQFYSI